MYVCMYVCLYICMHACMYVWMDAYMIFRSMSNSLHITASLSQGVHSTRPIAFSANLCKIAARGEVIDFPPGNTTSQDPERSGSYAQTISSMSKLSNPAVSKLPGPVCDMSAGLALMNPFRGRENWSFTSSPDAPTSSTAFSSANMALQALQALQAIQACAESHCAEKIDKKKSNQSSVHRLARCV